MPQMNIFRWRPGRGWLVLSGGGAMDTDDNQEIDAQMLGVTHSLGPIAYIWAASDLETADQHLDLLGELGARTGFLVDILSEDDETLVTQLSEAGVIIVGDGPQQERLRDALIDAAALQAIGDAFTRGATVYAVGRSAALLGAQTVENGRLIPGLKWITSALVMPGYSAEGSQALRDWLIQMPDGFGLGLGPGAALALGPQNEVEVWGNRAVTIFLGQQYQSEEE